MKLSEIFISELVTQHYIKKSLNFNKQFDYYHCSKNPGMEPMV